MARSKTSSIRINPEVWRESKLLATSRGKTIGGLVENLLKRELREAKKKGWGINEESH